MVEEHECPVRRLPENFYTSPEGAYFPNRILQDNGRMRKFYEIANSITPLENVKRRLKDLIFNNCAGRNFPLPNNAGDFIGAVDSEKADDPRLKNCIVLIKVKGKLAVAGGFNDIGEAMTQTIAREAAEETGATHVDNFVVFGEQSVKIRDNRFQVISACASAVIDPEELQAKDDADEIVIVPLIDENGDLNDSYFAKGEYLDAKGKKFSHDGLRADHGEIITKLYNWWKENGKPKGLALDQALKEWSKLHPQKWFSDYNEHPAGADVYPRLDTPYGQIWFTPNVKFALEQTIKILAEANIEDAERKAQQFVINNIKADILPQFPQAATTVDCLIMEGDSLIVFQRADGRLSLPGRFYSPEPQGSPHEEETMFAPNLATFAQQVSVDEFGIDFRPKYFVGTVGGKVALGRQTDDRYPRLSYVFAGIPTATYTPKEGDIPPGSKIIKIPIWENKAEGILSKEILQGINGQGWAYGHTGEILIPLLGPALQILDPTRRLTAEQAVRRQQLFL